MSGETYVKRYPGGFVDLPAQTTAIDSQFLNTVESALVRLLGEDPADGEVGVWSAGLGRLVYQFLTNAQVAAGAGISRAKLDFGVGLVDADIAPGAAISSSKISGLTGGAIPSGVIVSYPGTTPPSGWLMCDGSAVSRTVYAGIFSVVGATYGAGDGSTTFNLPDFRGRVPVYLGTHVNVATLGGNEGVAVGSRQNRHSHVFVGSAGNTSTESVLHSHPATAGSQGWFEQWTGGNLAMGSGTNTRLNPAGQPGPTQSVLHTHPFTPAGTVGTAGVSETPAYLVVNAIIKT